MKTNMPIYNEKQSFNDLIGSSGSKPTKLEFSLAATKYEIFSMKCVETRPDQNDAQRENNFR